MEWCQLNAMEGLGNNPSKCPQQVEQQGTNNLLGAQLEDLQCRQILKVSV